MFFSVLFYTLLSSSVFVYGIGLTRLTFYSQSPRLYFIKLFKLLCTVAAASSLSYFFSVNLLCKNNLQELFPFITLLIFITVSVFIEIILRLCTRTSTAEFAISFLSVLLAMAESNSMIECIIISSSCIVSFFILVPVLNAIRKKTSAKGKAPFDIFILLLTFAVIILTSLWWNTSWLNGEVFK